MIKKVLLDNFRNFKKKSLDFSGEVTTIVGPNAVGKTNILEALFFLSTAKSFKAGIESEMINYNTDIARLSGTTGDITLEAILTKGLIDIGADHPEKAPRKKLLVNKIPRRSIDFAGNFKTVLFGPWDMDLVTESPSIRRRFLDNVLSQVDREYRRSILSYEKGLRQRNKLLFRIREEGIPRGQLVFWNQLLIKNGDYILRKREEFIDFVNSSKYPINGNQYFVEYDKSVISEGRLEQYREEEIAAATTLVGPHRDDFIFKVRNKNKEMDIRDLAAYGSRGEQRMGILWIKLSELDYIEEKTGVRPTLLLDDIFSELDHEHRDMAMLLSKKQQTIITTADAYFLKGLKSDVTISL